jgi:hypothetical protein
MKNEGDYISVREDAPKRDADAPGWTTPVLRRRGSLQQITKEGGPSGPNDGLFDGGPSGP